MEQTTIREAKLLDHKAIAKLCYDVYYQDGFFNQKYGELGTRITLPSVEMFAYGLLTNENVKSFIGEKNGELVCVVIGGLCNYTNIGQENKISMVAIVSWAEDKINCPKGMSGEILKKLEDWGKDQGATVMYCGSHYGWSGARNLPWVLMNLYGFTPDQFSYIKEIK